jgi:hypothetical protein
VLVVVSSHVIAFQIMQFVGAKMGLLSLVFLLFFFLVDHFGFVLGHLRMPFLSEEVLDTVIYAIHHKAEKEGKPK